MKVNVFRFGKMGKQFKRPVLVLESVKDLKEAERLFSSSRIWAHYPESNSFKFQEEK